MQSHDYVPGVSGWKIEKCGRFELNHRNQRVIADAVMITTSGPGQSNDQAAALLRTSISEETQYRAKADDAPVAKQGSTAILTALNCLTIRITPKPYIIIDGVTYISQAEVERASGTKVEIESTYAIKMGVSTSGKLKSPIADQVRDVLRTELQPGGILYRK